MSVYGHRWQRFSLLFLFPLALAASTSPETDNNILINCGGPPSEDGGGWRSDEESPFSLSPTTATATATATVTSEADHEPPYDSARVFWAPLTYSIPISTPGPKLVRLHFSTSTTFNSVEPAQFFVSLNANGFTFLLNFSAYLAAEYAAAYPYTNAPIDQGQVEREFFVTVPKGDKILKLNFSPGSQSSNGRSYGIINGIEVISVPEGLYVPPSNSTSVNIPYLYGGSVLYPSSFTFPEMMAMEAILRLNAGGVTVHPSSDSGGLRRTWYQDQQFLGGFPGQIAFDPSVTEINYTSSNPDYTAPKTVYLTLRIMGNYSDKVKLMSNLTWTFEVDAGFSYLVRLHFCNLFPEVNRTGDMEFKIYINSQVAETTFDVIGEMHGVGLPIHKDYVTLVGDDNANGNRTNLSVALHPRDDARGVNAFLNGLEIFKLNNSHGSLAAPNPNPPITSPSIGVNNNKKGRHLVPVVIGATLGFTLLMVAAFVLLFTYFRKRKEAASATIIPTSKKPSSNPKWTPISTEESQTSSSTATVTSTLSSVASNLPSDLCRRFSLSQIRIATSDFDDSAVIGSGGFGKVYKGSVDQGATVVAIKRLNPSSNQGANEFRNEIEMLSRLRHVHLVSLIGYCEEHGEMVLVYEYMPRGTLRDHLMYKTGDRTENVTPLSWKQRLMICLGSARGLHYLHSGSKQPIIHRDVKSTNILLDDKWTAKVSDFGLSKVGPDVGVSHVSTAVKGSIGYLDPEYYRLRQLTEKSDVYSFGVVLFEVLCARQPINPNLPKDQVNLAMWAGKHYKNGTLNTIIDPNLGGQIAPESLRKYGEVAAMCVRGQGTERPSMADVVWALEFALQLQLTADQKNNGGINGGDQEITTEDEMFSSSGDKMSLNRSSETVKSVNVATDASTSEVESDEMVMRTASVFSEINHPESR